ncbi:MAG: 16S rRNA (cytidine(1402)-2'-O)-methyltransferase [Bdellovibrionaceae bacterium]|nr:16S rRNA (cytidine(1402)-2'-O)-methyltransferase [Pseudobdellovibrionaceae bacterium]
MLQLVAVPIGEPGEITFRAIEALKNCEILICESTKEASRLLKHYGIAGKTYELLNEHSSKEDYSRLASLCQEKVCALISDAGTPGFCDPGAELVRLCRQKGVEIRSLLGPSALMGLLSLSSRRLDEFVFRGFLPAENKARQEELKKLKKEKRAIILMDTPYRLEKLLSELAACFPERQALLVTDLSLPSEKHFEDLCANLPKICNINKSEFMILIYPDS